MEILDHHARPDRVPRLFLKADGRSYRAKRYKVIRRALLNQLQDEPTLHQVTMCESAASIQLQLEELRSDQVNGVAVDPAMLVKLTNVLRRHLRDLALSESNVR